MRIAAGIPLALLLTATSHAFDGGQQLRELKTRYAAKQNAAISPVLKSYLQELDTLWTTATHHKDYAGVSAIQQEMDAIRAQLAQATATPSPRPAAPPKQVTESPQKPAGEAISGLVKNPGFEGGMSAWSVYGQDRSKTRIESGSARGAGRYMVLSKAKGIVGAGAYQDLAAIPWGQTLLASCWVMKPEGPGVAYAGIELKGPKDENLLVGANTVSTVGNGGWEQISIEIKLPDKQSAPAKAVLRAVFGLYGPEPIELVGFDDVVVSPKTN